MLQVTFQLSKRIDEFARSNYCGASSFSNDRLALVKVALVFSTLFQNLTSSLAKNEPIFGFHFNGTVKVKLFFFPPFFLSSYFIEPNTYFQKNDVTGHAKRLIYSK